jgi:FlaA1/EpsC-like NDP-sugar epimerase
VADSRQDGDAGPVALTSRVARASAKMRADLPLAFLDLVLVSGVYTSVLLLRFDGAVPPRYWSSFLLFLPVALTVHLVANGLAGLYGRVWLHAGIEEAQRILRAGAGAAAALALFLLPGERPVPASVVVLGAALAPTLFGGLRFQARLFALHRAQARHVTSSRVVVVGAGDAGTSVIRDMQRDPRGGLRAVAVLDEDPRKHGRKIADVPVAGGLEALRGLASQHDLDMVLLAVPSADRRFVRRVVTVAEAVGLPVKVLPRVSELVGGDVGVSDVRDLEISDLLGREQVVTDLDGVRSILAGRRVLVTGAGGSIGAEIARQVAACAPAELVLLDHDETHLHDASARLGGQGVQVLADIRDPRDVEGVFARHRPQVVFHAAAHKHVPLLESHPCEAVRTNVGGAENVARVAAAHGVERLVFISTDKAVRPRSVMGASKRLGELLVGAYAPPGAHWCAVRFGNVLGSRGSVVPTFVRQIREGGPVTVTDPRMTRFFMSIEEAVQLVLQAAVFAEDREIFMLDMGEPIRIIDLAERMIRLSGHRVGEDVEIRITGRRPGEKTSEELRHPEEVATTTPHPSIVALHPASLDVALVEKLPMLLDCAERRDDAAARELLLGLTAPPVEEDGEVTLPPVGS